MFILIIKLLQRKNKIKEIEYEDENIFLYYSIKERKFKIFNEKENINYLFGNLI